MGVLELLSSEGLNVDDGENDGVVLGTFVGERVGMADGSFEGTRVGRNVGLDGI